MARLVLRVAPGSRSSMTFRHLVFDLDGTLVDTKDDLAEAVNVALTAVGLPREDPRTLWGYVGQGARKLVERALGTAHAHRLDEAVAVFMPWYREHLLDHAVVYDGLRLVIDTLVAEGAQCSILTNKPADMSRTIVNGLELAGNFPRLIGGDSLPVKKPDPAGLLALIAETDVPATATLMIGDSAVDVATGRGGGAVTCGVCWGFNGSAVVASQPDVSITAPGELLDLVRHGLPRRV